MPLPTRTNRRFVKSAVDTHLKKQLEFPKLFTSPRIPQLLRTFVVAHNRQNRSRRRLRAFALQSRNHGPLGNPSRGDAFLRPNASVLSFPVVRRTRRVHHHVLFGDWLLTLPSLFTSTGKSGHPQPGPIQPFCKSNSIWVLFIL